MIAIAAHARLSPLPGLAVAAGIAAIAVALRQLPLLHALSPAILAILLGMGMRQAVGRRPAFLPGFAMAMRNLLRLAVMLLGLQLTLGQIAELGPSTLVRLAMASAVCFIGTVWLGRRLGVAPRLTRLLAAGTAICGASAVIAANSVVRGDDDEVAYALASVTLIGTIAMVATPLAAAALGLDSARAGLWIGASIHEVAQVVGAATQLGDNALRVAASAKLARILFLAPLVFAMAAHGRRPERGGAKVPAPLFVGGFLAAAAARSFDLVPAECLAPASEVTGFLLATALAAMGFSVEPKAIMRRGAAPLALAVSSWALIAGISLL